jgi:hypothetical protein
MNFVCVRAENINRVCLHIYIRTSMNFYHKYIKKYNLKNATKFVELDG